MPKFCGHCGSPLDGGAFCAMCGSPIGAPATPPAPEPVVPAPDEGLAATGILPVEPQAGPGDAAYDVEPEAPAPAPAPAAPAPAPAAPAAPAQPPPPAAPPQAAWPAWDQAAPFAPGGQQQGVGWSQPPAPQRPPRPPQVNPFRGWPISDYVRDGVAAVALLTALGMPWDMDGDGADRWWVIIAVLLSVASLAVPYVGKSALIPGWTRQHVRITKLAFFLPLLASVFAGVVNELIHLGDEFAGGIGSGVAVALAGGLLAVSPREADEEPTHAADGLWIALMRVATGAALFAGLASFLAYFVRDLTGPGYLLDDIPTLLTALLILPVMFLVVVGGPGVGLMGLRAPSRRVFVVVGATLLCAALLALANDGVGLVAGHPVEKWDTPVGGLFLLGAATSLATTWPVHRATSEQINPVAGWVATARLALSVTAGGLAVSAASMLASMAAIREVDAALLISMMLTALSGVAALVARSLLDNVRQTRVAILGIAIGIVMVGAVTVAVLYNAASSQVTGAELAVWFALPPFAIYCLVAPAAVRSELGALLPAAPAGYASAPAAYQPPPVAPPSTYPGATYPQQQWAAPSPPPPAASPSPPPPAASPVPPPPEASPVQPPPPYRPESPRPPEGPQAE